MIRQPRRSRDGFTLIEVLAAMVLIAVVLPVAMHAANVTLQSAAQARHRQEASLLAEMKLGEVLATRDPSSVGTSGDFGDDWPRYRWDLVTATTDFGCYEVTVTVYWQRRGRDESLSMTTLVYPADSYAFLGSGP